MKHNLPGNRMTIAGKSVFVLKNPFGFKIYFEYTRHPCSDPGRGFAYGD